MNCRDFESLILAERDGALSPEKRAALSDHIAACPACRGFSANLTAALDSFRADVAGVPVPDADQAWRDLQDRLHAGAKSAKKRPLAPVIWFATPLAAAAAIALVFFSGRSPSAHPESIQPAPRAVAATVSPPPSPMATSVSPELVAAITEEVARAEYVEAGDVNASTMVYVDKESGWLVVWATDAGDTKTSG